jgi:hypothetical protein
MLFQVVLHLRGIQKLQLAASWGQRPLAEQARQMTTQETGSSCH